jgi:hypothetical protein
MAKCKSVTCQTPFCSNVFLIRVDSKSKSLYCKPCKDKYPITLLKLQTEYNLLVPDLFIKVSNDFNFESGQRVAFIFGVTRQILIKWLREYVGVNSWVEFKKVYYCKSKCCYIADMSSFDVTKNPYYLINKLKKEHDICSCKYTLYKCEQPSGRVRIKDAHAPDNNKNQILIRITGPETLKKIGLVSLEKEETKEKK